MRICFHRISRIKAVIFMYKKNMIYQDNIRSIKEECDTPCKSIYNQNLWLSTQLATITYLAFDLKALDTPIENLHKEFLEVADGLSLFLSFDMEVGSIDTLPTIPLSRKTSTLSLIDTTFSLPRRNSMRSLIDTNVSLSRQNSKLSLIDNDPTSNTVDDISTFVNMLCSKSEAVLFEAASALAHVLSINYVDTGMWWSWPLSIITIQIILLTCLKYVHHSIPRCSCRM